MSTLSVQWIAALFVRNVLLITLVAGGLHVLLFTFCSQGNKLKFDHREQLEKTKKFSIGSQVHDNILWSIASGVTVWPIYEVLYLRGVANKVIPTLGFASNPIAFVSWLIILPPLMSAHFYLIHRLLHWPPLFKRVHLLHHKNIHIGPWSGMSIHPVEHIIYISSVLIHFVIASHPVILLLHLYTRCLAPAFSHSGFEKLLIKDKAITEAADFHHQLHHKYFECNYGNVDMPWDRWFGSVHDGSEKATHAVKERRLNMYKNRA